MEQMDVGESTIHDQQPSRCASSGVGGCSVGEKKLVGVLSLAGPERIERKGMSPGRKNLLPGYAMHAFDDVEDHLIRPSAGRISVTIAREELASASDRTLDPRSAGLWMAARQLLIAFFPDLPLMGIPPDPR